MKKKHTSRGIPVINGEDLIVLNSFDRAEAFKSQKNIGSIISFSSSLFTPSMIQSKTINGGSIFNICTWMQTMGKENLDMIKCELDQSYWDDHKSLVVRLKEIDTLPLSEKWLYDIHDAKMLYLLLQHLQWNRIRHHFLACKCKRNVDLYNENHECIMIDDSESTRI